MPLYALTNGQARELALFPESGMGFQVIRAELPKVSYRVFIALNSEILLPADTKNDLVESFRDLGRIEQIEDLSSRLERMKWIRKPVLIASMLDPEIGVEDDAAHILQSQPVIRQSTTAQFEAFFRYSAFPNECRVHKNGSFKSGTYATTANDVRMVPSGFASVGRYALPSSRSAKFVYVITPEPTPINVGTVVPNHGQAGGGVEVLFKRKAIAIHGSPYEIAEA